MLYPIFLEIDGAPCVVVGGGQVAQRKVQSLIGAGAHVKVVSPDVSPRIQELAVAEKLEWIAEPYRQELLDGAWLVFATTDDAAINQQIANDAREIGAIANVAEPPEAGDFLVPATFKRGDICVAVSTGGASPALAKKLREQLEVSIGEEYAELAHLLGELRPVAEEKIKAQNKRQKFYEAVVNSGILDMLRAGQADEARRQCDKLMTEHTMPQADQ